MTEKKSLGKGLDILFNVNADETADSIKTVDVHLIDTNEDQPRKTFDRERLHELATSIERHGMVQPIIVRKKGERFMIVAGERRFRAAHIAGLSAVPVVIRDIDDNEILEVALVENLQREDLNPVEEALAIRCLMEQHDLTQQEVADRLAKSRPAIANTLRLLSLPELVLSFLRSEKIQAGHARALTALKDAQTQEALANEIVEKNLSVREVEKKVKTLLEPRAEQMFEKVDRQRDPELLSAMERLRERLNTRVSIKGTENRGKIIIEYYSKSDLHHIYDAISG